MRSPEGIIEARGETVGDAMEVIIAPRTVESIYRLQDEKSS